MEGWHLAIRGSMVARGSEEGRGVGKVRGEKRKP